MDVVVRTPHGDADIEIVAAPAATTLAALLTAVTGQAAPATSRVDGRAVATTRLLADLGLVIGSLIDTRPESDVDQPADSAGAAVGFVQLTGRGAGRTVRLRTGRFRVGSARRLHADELDPAPVETSAFDIEVAQDGVRVRPGPNLAAGLGDDTPTLGGQVFDRELPWIDERLDVGGRLFELEIPYRRHERHRVLAPNDDGSVPFQRIVGARPTRRRVIVDAIDDAMSGADGLWARRRTDPDAYTTAFGLRSDGSTVASVDLHRHRGVALVGADRFTSSLARTMLIDLATQHGPADLDIAIASTPDHVARWNWAKWLPHVHRAGPSSPPQLFAGSSALAAWVTSTDDPPRAGADVDARPVTLLVLDDLSLWSQRDSPVRSLLIDRPPHLRIMALCAGLHEAPGMCTALVEEVQPLDRLAHLASVTTSSAGRSALFGSLATQHDRLADAQQVVTDIRPALLETPLAADVARALAPLDDLEAVHRLDLPGRVDAPTLSELVDLAVTTPTTAPTSAPDDPTRPTLDVPIGIAVPVTVDPVAVEPVTVDLAAALPTVLVAGDPARHDQTLAALLLGAAAQRRPDEMAILIISHERPAWHSELAHVAGWAGRDEADDASRLTHRIAHVLAEHPHLHALIVVERAFANDDAMPPELVHAMTELTGSHPNAHLVLTGDHLASVPDADRSRFASLVSIGDDGDGQLWIGERLIAFESVALRSPVPEAGRPAPALVIRPTTHGRAMTPLERRLTRSIVDSSTADDGSSIAAIARRVSTLASDGQSPPSGPVLLAPPLPAAIDFATLLERHPGDGIPIGLVDRPERAGNEAYWWQPGSGGSILAVGSPRSGMTALLDLIICGTAARFSADDVHLYAVEALPQRRRAIESLPHTGNVATPDEPEAVRRLIEGLHRVHTERMRTRSGADLPHLVLLIGDVSRMLRSLRSETGEATRDQLAAIAASGASIGMNVIAIASRVDDVGPLAGLTGDRLVGSTSDPADRAELGAPPHGLDDQSAGRCWSTAADRRVQLASPPPALDAEIRRLAPEPAGHCPPVPLIGGARP